MLRFPVRSVSLSSTLALLSACSGGSGDPSSSDVAMRFSDAPVDTASKVVVTVDSISFVRADDTLVVDTFTSAELGIEDADTFTIDLLDVQGEDSRLVLDSVILPVGQYSDLRLDIVDEDINFSYVEEDQNSERKNLKVPSGELKLGAFEVTAQSTQTFVIEFGLRQSMTYNPGPDRYILKPRGVRIVALEAAATITGQVDVATLNLDEACSANPDELAGNPVYLYAGAGLALNALADDFDAAIAGDAGAGLTAPIASSMLDMDGHFTFAYLEPGDYTIAATCAVGDDDPDNVDGLLIPSPASAILETSIQRGQRVECVIGGEAQGCAVLAPAGNQEGV